MFRIEQQKKTAFRKMTRGFWLGFLVWSTIGAVVMFLGLSVPDLVDAQKQPALVILLDHFDRHADAVWMALAAATLVALLVPCWGFSVTLRSLLCIAVVTGILETIGVLSGFPFGDYAYTDRYGLRLFGVLPLAIPLAWFVVVAGGGAVVFLLMPDLSRWKRACSVALLAVLTDLNLEPIAWKLRGYWIWYPDATDPPVHPPLSNYMAWFVIAFAMALWLPRFESARRPSSRIVWLFLILNGVLLAGHLGMLVRS
jgi:putative membrane protein